MTEAEKATWNTMFRLKVARKYQFLKLKDELGLTQQGQVWDAIIQFFDEDLTARDRLKQYVGGE